MADIEITDVRKSFEEGRVLLDHVSFHIDPGERVALLGDNGTGKTTLMRMIAGEIAPDQGRVMTAAGKRIGYVRQINEARPGETVGDVLRGAYSDVIAVADELDRMHRDMTGISAYRYEAALKKFEARGGYAWEADMAKIANGLAIGPEMRAQLFSSLSGGEQTRVNLARAIMEQADILLLDEPTNHLDMASLEWLEDYLLHYKGTVLAISHDRYFLDVVAQRIIELDQGKAEFYSGNYTYYTEEKEVRRAQQLMRYNREQAKIKQLEFQIARLKAWGSVYDNPALHKKAAAMEKRIERIGQTDRPTEKEAMRAGFSSEAFRADRVLEMNGIEKSFDGRKLFGPVTAGIRGGGEKVALLGANGTGKSTLLKILLGEERADKGTVTIGPSVRIAYLPQQVVFSHPERTLYDTLLYETSATPQEARDRLGLFRFTGEEQFKRVSQLSGGEKARLRLCIIMMSKANLLILDEPTNHLDLASREWIEEAVDAFQGTLLFVSHDRYFVRRFANRVWELDNGFHDYPNSDWERYRRIRALSAAKRAEEARPEKKAEAPVQKSAPPSRDPKRERRMNAIEREIARREEEIAGYEARMEENATDYAELARLQEEKQAKESELEGLYSEWEALSEG